MSHPRVEALLARLQQQDTSGIGLIVGDLVVAEPAGAKVARGLAESLGCEVEQHRRPSSLQALLDDLCTFSLFETGKVRLVVETALFADRNSAATLIDDAAEVLPVAEGSELSPRQRAGAARLLQALRVFAIDPQAGSAEDLLDALPNWAFMGGPGWRKKRNNRGRGKKQAATLREQLVPLVEGAIEGGMVGWAEDDLAQLGDLLERGLPQGHHLILVESTASAEHPVAARLAESGAFLEVGSVSVGRRGDVEGLGALAATLAEETGVSIAPDALRELARRTVKRERMSSRVDSVSTGRLAAEYRKIANLAEGRIDLALVRDAVEDRGEQDVFEMLDAISAGDVAGALRRLERHLQSSDDAGAAVFGFFSLLAQYAGHISVVRGLIEQLGMRKVERNYNRFKDSVAPRLQSAPVGSFNPIAKMHPFRLHRIYLAAARWSSRAARELPGQILDCEARLKGDSSNPNVVLSELVVRLSVATVPARGARSSQRRRA